VKTSFRKLTIVAAVTVAMTPLNTVAQQTDAVFEEVVVTATKRSATLQDIPIAVSVTSAETIEKAEIRDVLDLQSVIPSLRVGQLNSSAQTNFIIRGFGNGDNNPGVEPSVGVFIDGVFRSRSAAAISDLPSLERVEVLRGPQSTLFGKNASAGVINVVTQKPTGEFGGKISATAGNFDSVIVKGEIQGALSDTVAYSVAAGTNTRDGYTTNAITGGDINNRDRQNIRGQLLYNPNERTEFRVIADYDTLDEECCAVVNLIAGPTFGAIQAIGGTLDPNDADSFTQFTNIDPTNQIDNAGVSLQIDHDATDFTITSITAFRNVDSSSVIDADFTSAAVILNALDTNIDTFTQEIRLTSNGGGALDWNVGAFYFDESIDFTDDLPFGPSFRPFVDALSAGAGAPGAIGALEQALGLPLGAFFPTGNGDTVVTALENEAISIFGQFDWHLNDRVTATLGLNYTRDEKEASIEAARSDAFSALSLQNLGLVSAFQQISGLAPTPANFAAAPQAFAAAQAASANPATNPLLGLSPFQFLPTVVSLPNGVESNETDDDEVTYNVRLAYELSDTINVYGGISTGFKASSFNLSRDSRPDENDLPALQQAGVVPGPFSLSRGADTGTRFAAPEEATVYELGLKAKFNRGAFNLTLFDQSIENFQVNTFTGAGFELRNAGEQSTKGLEFDLTYFVTDALKLNLAGTFLDPTFDSFESITGQSLSGTTPGGIADTNFSLGFDYGFAIGNHDAFVRADYFFEEETQIGDEGGGTGIDQFNRETSNLNATVGVRTANGYSLTLWARNLTDHESLISAFPSVAQGGSFSGYRTAPRTYGVSFSYDF